VFKYFSWGICYNTGYYYYYFTGLLSGDHFSKIIPGPAKVAEQKLWRLQKQDFLQVGCFCCHPTNSVKALRNSYPPRKCHRNNSKTLWFCNAHTDTLTNERTSSRHRITASVVASNHFVGLGGVSAPRSPNFRPLNQ